MTELEIKPLNFEIVNIKQIENVIDELSKKVIAAHFQLVEIKEWFWPIFEAYETKTEDERKEVDRFIPSLGYVSGNCVASCRGCNTIKADTVKNDERFRKMKCVINIMENVTM